MACGTSAQVNRAAIAPVGLPAAKSFAPTSAQPFSRDAASFQRDFMRLAFTLESGRPLPVFSRFEGPVTVRLTGKARSRLVQRDLDHLIARLRAEAKIPITRVAASEQANISIELIDQSALQDNLSLAARHAIAGHRTALPEALQATDRRGDRAVLRQRQVSATKDRAIQHPSSTARPDRSSAKTRH